MRTLQHALILGLLAGLFSGLLSCRQDKEVAESGSFASAKLLGGGDQNAWLTDNGDLSGNSRCRARLRLPLEKEPVWEFSYTPAQFSDKTVNQILHYDGTLAIAARGPQILMLNARSGKLVLNKDVYKRMEFDEENDPAHDRERFDSITFSEDGALLGLDDMGRYYSWTRSGDELKRRWLGPPVKYGQAGLMATRGAFISGGDDVVYSAALDSGEKDWAYPSQQVNKGISCSRDKRAVCWTTQNQVNCLDMTDGRSIWACAMGSSVERGTINDDLGCVYLARQDEVLECRSMADGSLLWEYDWSGLLSDEDRERMAGDLGRWSVTIPLWSVSANQHGVALQMASGDLLFLDGQGKLLWQKRLDTAAATGLLFDNAYIVMQIYFEPDLRARPSVFDPFNREPPDWAIIKDTVKLVQDSKGDEKALQRAKSELYIHLAVLNPEDGSEIDGFEPDVLPLCGLTPACDNIVFGGTQEIKDEVLRTRGKAPVRRIRAYHWLEPEG